jgi:hypothetical protein
MRASIWNQKFSTGQPVTVHLLMNPDRFPVQSVTTGPAFEDAFGRHFVPVKGHKRVALENVDPGVPWTSAHERAAFSMVRDWNSVCAGVGVVRFPGEPPARVTEDARVVDCVAMLMGRPLVSAKWSPANGVVGEEIADWNSRVGVGASVCFQGALRITTSPAHWVAGWPCVLCDRIPRRLSTLHLVEPGVPEDFELVGVESPKDAPVAEPEACSSHGEPLEHSPIHPPKRSLPNFADVVAYLSQTSESYRERAGIV